MEIFLKWKQNNSIKPKRNQEAVADMERKHKFHPFHTHTHTHTQKKREKRERNVLRWKCESKRKLKSPASQSPYRDMLLHLNGGLGVNTSGLRYFIFLSLLFSFLYLVKKARRHIHACARPNRIATMSSTVTVHDSLEKKNK